MSKKILSEIVQIPKSEELSTEFVETELNKRFGNLLRWAITAVEDNYLKIALTYEKEA